MANERLFAPIQDHSILPQTGYLRLPDVLRLIPVSRSTWWQGVRDGRFPASVKLGPRTTAWAVADIRACIAALQAKASK